MVASALAFLVSAVYLSVPLENPGVQDCGSPGAYLVTNRQDRMIEVGTPDAPPDAVQLRTQPSCRDRVGVALERAGLFVAAGVGIGLIGVVLGLIDDRMRLRREPRFEDLLQARPVDAPVPIFDPRPVDVATIGDRLARVDRFEAALVLGGGAAGVVGLVAMAGVEPLREALGRMSIVHVAVLAAVVALQRIAAGFSRWLSLGPWSGAGEGSEMDPVEGTQGTADPEELAEVALAADGQARLSPSLGVAGLDLHHLVVWGVPRHLAEARVRAQVTIALAVHVLLMVAAWLLAGGGASEPEGRTYVVALAVLAVTCLLGALRVKRRWRATAVRPGIDALGAALEPERRMAGAAALGGAFLQVLLEVAALWLVVAAVAEPPALAALALIWLVATSVGALSPVGSGAGLTDGVLAVLLWRLGLSAAEATAAVLVLRAASWWLPMVPGMLATRRLRAESRL